MRKSHWYGKTFKQIWQRRWKELEVCSNENEEVVKGKLLKIYDYTDEYNISLEEAIKIFDEMFENKELAQDKYIDFIKYTYIPEMYPGILPKLFGVRH